MSPDFPQTSLTRWQGKSTEQDILQDRPQIPQPSEPTSQVKPREDDNIGPLPGPSASRSAEPLGPSIHPEDEDDEDDRTTVPPLSPYTYERQRIQELTMPAVPNFDIPDSPPPPIAGSEAAVTLADTTVKFTRFLALKKQGVHFNERLQESAALRNPSLLPKLRDWAGITQEQSYASSLPAEVAVPGIWPEECYVDGLIRQNERRLKKAKGKAGERDRMDFVPASTSVETDRG